MLNNAHKEICFNVIISKINEYTKYMKNKQGNNKDKY
jgi:hypothetical protein